MSRDVVDQFTEEEEAEGHADAKAEEETSPKTLMFSFGDVPHPPFCVSSLPAREDLFGMGMRTPSPRWSREDAWKEDGWRM